jgi:hypothetical protein
MDIPAALDQIFTSPAETFQVSNGGGLPLVVTAVLEDVSWLAIAPASATVAPGDSVEFVATFDATGYEAGTYHTTVTVISNDPGSPHSLAATMTIGDVTSITEDDEDTNDGAGEDADPEQSPLLPDLRNYPNPFNPQTLLRFTVPHSGMVELAIYDLKGAMVKILMRARLVAGRYERTWNGRDEHGRMVPSGVYLALMRGPDGRQTTRKLVLMR